MSEKSNKCSWLLRYASTQYSDIKIDTVCQGIVEGNRGWALVEENNLSEYISQYDYKSRFKLLVDYSECRLGYNDAIVHPERSTSSSVLTSGFVVEYGGFAKKLNSIHFNNRSPSLWDNGFGICEYLDIELFRFKDSKYRLLDAIKGKCLIDPTEVPKCANWQVVAEQIAEKMKPIVVKLGQIKPLIPRGEDDFYFN